MTEMVSGHELVQTFDCRTPGCRNEARSRGGRHAYCRECQIRRGTRRPDGSFISEAIPTSPGSRHVRDLFAGDGAGPFETDAIEVVAVAREVDALLGTIRQAQEKIADAKSRLPAAVELWRQTLERVATVDVAATVAATIARPPAGSTAPQSRNGADAD